MAISTGRGAAPGQRTLSLYLMDISPLGLGPHSDEFETPVLVEAAKRLPSRRQVKHSSVRGRAKRPPSDCDGRNASPSEAGDTTGRIK